MARLKGALLVFILAVTQAAPAAAQIGGHPFEIIGGAGSFTPDIRARMEMGPAYLGGLGWRASPSLSVELNGLWAPSRADTTPAQDHNFFLGSVDLRWNLRPAFHRFVPYILAGAGLASSHTLGRAPDLLQRGAGTLGLGLLTNVHDERWFLRLQVRDVLFRERGQQEFSNHIAATAGVQLLWRSQSMDADRDRVRDGLDRCPDTPIGATVDVHGCPADADGDGVLNGIDKCDTTPKGCTIDATGCEKDADGDGVCDGLDTCADTPKGATVDARGCPSDSDGDGVLDGIDQCANTPGGATISATGCPNDADGDGVFDGLDQCPNTPAGFRVDTNGCPIEVSEKEIQLLDTGSIRIQNINFDTGKASIKPESFAVIDTVARILVQYPTLRIEIGGHTDNRGSKGLNDALSQERADSVLAYLRARFPGLDASQYSARGYGMDRPVAPNRTDLGRARNRRVEFRVTNTEALRIEREKRRFLLKGEPAPITPVTPAAPAAPVVPDLLAPPPVTPVPPDSTRN
ncbi:MAG: OmpA family protein [Candidatus Eisenbacteria bacterium]